MSYTVKGTWRHVEDQGWQYAATAVMPNGRVVARTTVTVPYDVGYAIDDLHGRDGREEIERLAQDLCERSVVPE